MPTKQFHIANGIRRILRPTALLSPGPDCAIFLRRRRDAAEQCRTLLTAVTNSPMILTKFPEGTHPPPNAFATLVDTAIAWAEQGHRHADPPTHAVVLVSKDLIPTGKDELLQGLGNSRRLPGLDSLIGIVDTVGEGAKGVSVLLASREERIIIDALAGLPPRELRVGRWHAKDTEENIPFNFADVIASIRGGPSVKPVETSSSPSDSREFIFALGDMETLSYEAARINLQYPSADIMGLALARTPMINTLFTTLVHNGVIIPSNTIASFRVPRRAGQQYMSPRFEHNISWLNENRPPTITSMAGNVIDELNNQRAMPYLLSILPPQSEEEKLNPLPLVARVPSLEKSGIVYVNVLGGSKSKGGIALDPLVATGHVSVGTKVEFGQIQQVYLPTFRPPNKSVHVQLEVLSRLSHRTKPEWETANLKREDRFMSDGFRRQQRWDGVPEFTYNKRPDYQGTQLGLFAAGSEGGFMMGGAGVVPWLSRIQGSRAQVQVTPCRRGQQHKPIQSKPKYPIDPEAHMAQIAQKKALRKYLKENNLIISKRIEFTTPNRWQTVRFLRKKEIPVEAQEPKAKRKKNPLDERRLEKEQSAARTVGRLQTRLQKRGARINFKSFVPYSTILVSRDSTTPVARKTFSLESQTHYIQDLMKLDPEVTRLLQSGRMGHIRFFGSGKKDLRGPRRFGFRSRRFWNSYRGGGFRRAGHKPGGLRFWGNCGKIGKHGQ